MPSFRHNGHRIAYTEFGSGPRTCVLIHGLLRAFEAPTLAIRRRREPIHPLSDAGMLADELPNARLLEADSIIELRVAPDRLTGEIAEFLDACWKPKRRATRRRRATAS